MCKHYIGKCVCVCVCVLGNASLAGLTNGSNVSSPNNIGSLVNLSGHQSMVSQSVASAVPMVGSTSRPLIGNVSSKTAFYFEKGFNVRKAYAALVNR